MNVDGEKKEDEGEKKTEYEDVQLTGCIDGLLGAEALEYQCPSCAKNVVAIKSVYYVLRLLGGSEY
jgi:ubiquitin carboxyl-terminal hydrolase 5/13